MLDASNHVERGLGDRIALIWDSAMVPTAKSLSYRELRDEVARRQHRVSAVGWVVDRGLAAQPK